jgi:hypothetical protein
MTPTPDDDLRRLLHDAVDDVHPHGTPADIRRRSEEGAPPMTTTSASRWLPLSLAAAAAMVLVIGGTFWLTNRGDEGPPVAGPSNSQSTSTSPSPSPTDTPPQSTSPSSSPSASTDPGPATRQVALPVYVAGEPLAGDRLFREFRKADVCADAACVWTATVAASVSGTPQDSDYRTLWPAPATAQWVKYDGHVISVSLAESRLADRPSGMSSDQAQMAIQQVVYSAQAAVNDGRKPVRLLLDGKPARSVLGIPATEPFTAGNPDQTLAPVQIFSPAEGSDVQPTFTVTGQAAAFEANVQWELMAGSKVVQRNFTTARECCTLAPYSFTVRNVAPGQYTLVVHDDDASGQGRTNTDTKDITVR